MFVIALLCSCSADDYDMGQIEDGVERKDRQKIAKAETFVDKRFYLKVIYSPKIKDYNNFVVFSKITITGRRAPFNRYAEYIGYSEQSQTQDAGDFSWDDYSIFQVRESDDPLQAESWPLTVEVDVVPYINNGDYKITLYNQYDDNNPEELGSWISEFAQAGDHHVFSNLELFCEEERQEEFYLSLYVEPV